MLTAGDALAKTLAKSQKVTFWSKNLDVFFLANCWRCSYAGAVLLIVFFLQCSQLMPSYSMRST